MTLPTPTYDLVLLLDTQAEDAVRAKIVSDACEAISAQGELLRHDEWGERALAYPIDHKTSAEYHLLQFHASTPELIAGMNRSLHITDGIVRFRINKLKPGTPEAPDMRSERAPTAQARPEAEPALDESPEAEPALVDEAPEAEPVLDEAPEAEPALDESPEAEPA
jgi:small subunit ribosomal protein S6